MDRFLRSVVDKRDREQLDRATQVFAAEEKARARKRAALKAMRIQTDQSQGEQVADADEKKCSKGCGRTLGPNNRSGICTPCQQSNGGRQRADSADVEGGAAVRKASATDDVRKQFRSLTSALGIDGDHLIDSFCRGWIARLKAKVEPVPEDDYQTSLERQS